MSGDHTKDTWYAVQYGKTFGTTGVLTGTAYTQMPLNMGDISLPYREYARTTVRGVGMDEDAVAIFNGDYKYKDCNIKQFVQTTGMVDYALTGVAGDVPAAMDMHWENEFGKWDAWGLIVSEFTLSGPEKVEDGYFPAEQIKFDYYDTLTGAADETVIVPLLKTQPQTWKDCDFYIDGTAVDKVKEASMTVRNSYTDPEVAGTYNHVAKFVEHREFEAEVTFYTKNTTYAIQGQEETINTYDIGFDNGLYRLAMTGMYIEESDINETKEFGVKEHKLSFRPASGFTINKEASA